VEFCEESRTGGIILLRYSRKVHAHTIFTQHGFGRTRIWCGSRCTEWASSNWEEEAPSLVAGLAQTLELDPEPIYLRVEWCRAWGKLVPSPLLPNAYGASSIEEIRAAVQWDHEWVQRENFGHPRTLEPKLQHSAGTVCSAVDLNGHTTTAYYMLVLPTKPTTYNDHLV